MTINEMIKKSLRVKVGKTPKYIEQLAEYGITFKDIDMSAQKYYALVGSNGRELVISKDYANKSGLFNPMDRYENADMDKFDYINYLTAPTKPKRL